MLPLFIVEAQKEREGTEGTQGKSVGCELMWSVTVVSLFQVFSAFCGGIYPGIQNAVRLFPVCCFSHTATATAAATATATATAIVTGYRLQATLAPAIGTEGTLQL